MIVKKEKYTVNFYLYIINYTSDSFNGKRRNRSLNMASIFNHFVRYKNAFVLKSILGIADACVRQ